MKRIPLEQRAISACYAALYDLTSGDRSQTFSDREELIAQLRAVVKADKARDRRRKISVPAVPSVP